MENTLLYFFSTIPQVLAAIIAFVFLFIFFKLQDFDKIINIQSSDFASILGTSVTNFVNWQELGTSSIFMSNYKSKYFIGISDLMFKICNERENDKKFTVDLLFKIAQKTLLIEEQRKSIIKKSKYLCIWGFSVISLSLFLIPFTKFIATNDIIMNFLFLFFITLTIISLIWVYKILSFSL